MASNSGSPASSPVPPPVSVPNGHFVNGEAGPPSQIPPGAGPPPPQPSAYSPYGGYAGSQIGAPSKPMMPPNSGSPGYPPNPRYPSGQSIAQQGGPTPTLNSLLQGRNQRMPSPGPGSVGPYGPSPNNAPYPQPWPHDPNFTAYRQPPPGSRPSFNPQPGPYPGQYHNMPPQHPGYGYPPGRYPPPPGAQPTNNSPSSSPVPPTTTSSGGPTDGPPPHPGHHEGKPSTTWTPPVQAGENSTAQNSQGAEGEEENSSDQGVTPGHRPSPSPTGSSRSISPAVGSHQRGEVAQSINPGPPSNHSDLGNGSSSGGLPAQRHPQPPMGPPSNAGYNPKGGPPNVAPPPGQPSYGGQPYGYYGPRPGYGPPPGSYPGPYGRPSGYPGYPSGPYQGGWNSSSPLPPPGAKGAPPPGTPASQPLQRSSSGPAPPGLPQYGPRPQSVKGYPPPGGQPPPGSGYNGPPMYNGPPQGYPGAYPGHGLPPASIAASQSGSSSASQTPTGPDGVPVHDESSQQSTLSQSSDRSEGGRQTPKLNTNFSQSSGYPPSSSAPPGSPHSSAPSPGGSMGSSAGGPEVGYPRDMASPNWQRTASSPGQMFNTSGFSGGAGQPPSSPSVLESTPGRLFKMGTKNSEMMMRLYELDDDPDRRVFLDKLLAFMEDRGTPVTQCPTINKSPLDLYKFYLYAKERGGYLECTKSKAWKDIAAQLGIGASSSGAYTLKKHYGKNLLAYECHFDRGGMDPAPLLAQVEGQAKKAKAAKGIPQPPPAPSPGSQDSRDSYSNSSEPPFMGGPPNSFPPNATPPPLPNSGPPSSDRPPSHPGSAYPPSSTYGYPPSSAPPSSYPYQQGSSGGVRPPWPPQSGSSTPGDMYNRSSWPQPPSGSYGPRPPHPAATSGPVPPNSAPQAPASSVPPYPGQQQFPDNYQKRQVGSTISRPLPSDQGRPVILGVNHGQKQDSFAPSKQAYPNNVGPANSPSAPYAGQSSSKLNQVTPSTQPQRGGPPPNAYPYQNQRPPIPPGGSQPQWQNRYPGPGGVYGPPSSGDRNWQPGSSAPRGPTPQWGNDRSPYYGSSGSSPGWNPPGMVPKGQIRPPYRPEMRGPIPMGPQRPMYPGSRGRESSFPPGCVEMTPPYMMKRRKYTKMEVQPVDGWRIVMALRSGLLMESTWALDVLNILLFDDNAVTYFGLGNMPGLLEALLEHWRAALIEMFGITEDLELNSDKNGEKRTRERIRALEDSKSQPWFLKKRRHSEDEELFTNEFDLGKAPKVDPEDKCSVLCGENLTKKARFVEKDVIAKDIDDEIFVTDTDREWDCDESQDELGMVHWLNGGGNLTSHIVTHFSMCKEKAAFSQFIRNSKSDLKVKTEKTKVNGVRKKESEEEPKPDESEAEEEDIIDRIQRLTGIILSDPDAARKRLSKENLEDENHVRDEPSLQLVSEANDNLGKRAVCVSTVLRNLSFVPGNDYELSKSPGLLAILGRLLLLHLWYPKRAPKQRNYDRGEEEESSESCSSLTGDDEWWSEYLDQIRENVMVILANIAGALDLEQFEEDISRPILNGLLEWAVSSSSYAQDPFPNVGPYSPVSPQRCAIEALCKLCLQESNVDLIISTPPFSRLEKLIKLLVKKLYRYEEQVLREFSINILYYLSTADSGLCRVIALADNTISLMLSFIEQAESNALMIAQQHGVNALRDNPDSMGTSLDMLRRAATTLSNLSRHEDNVPLFSRQEPRLLNLVMSQILDQGVAGILSNVLFNIGINSPPPSTFPALPPLSPPPESATETAKSCKA